MGWKQEMRERKEENGKGGVCYVRSCTKIHYVYAGEKYRKLVKIRPRYGHIYHSGFLRHRVRHMRLCSRLTALRRFIIILYYYYYYH